ncbi:M3 family metallopeptidase [Kiritimatiellota bacterium B12222]|nr:M3 family metallopeptidase [Kiritimatiellota bacterium B12222]
MSQNPLLTLQHQHGPLPLDCVQTEDFVPAIDAALEDARKNIAAITENPAPPTFENTILALEASDEWLDRVSSVFFHLLHVDADDALQALAREIPPKLSAFRNDVVMNRQLFERIDTLDQQKASLSLSDEEAMVLENHLLSFRRNGASLSEADQKTLREIDQELSTCSPTFSEHVLKATQAFTLWTDDETVVSALPESAQANAKALAKKEGRDTEWKFTLDAPSFIAFMTYAPDADLRKKIWQAYGSRCVEGEFANQDLIRKILDLRYRRAQLLGYRDHVHYTLERRMAGNRETLEKFYAEMLPVVMPAAHRDLEAVRACKAAEGGDSTLNPWDYAYYAEKCKQQTFELNQEELRPWFELESTLNAVFSLVKRLFSVEFIPTDTLPVNHPEVRCYRVQDVDNGEEVGHLMIDPFPRSTKKPGAWMVALLGQGRWQNEVKRPTVGIVCNFTPPVEGKPSLLTMDEARTLFHEFGHAIHELLSDCHCRSVAGTNVYWDFVELPSQLLENWLQEPEFLREYALHVDSKEPLPEKYIEKIQASKTFQKGYAAARQLTFGLLDLAWYTRQPDELGPDLIAFEQEATRATALFPFQEGVAMSPSFQHIFSGGYASGYYSYKWAEVLEADIFDVFLDKGLYDQETASDLRNEILSQGGSQHPMELFKNFYGREPNPEALLKRDGLIA